MIEGRGVDSNIDGFLIFSVNLFVVLVYYIKVGDVGSGMVVGSDMTCVLLLFFKHLLGSSM